MNEIEFVVAPFEFGAGLADGVEPVVDGMSLVNIFGRADGEIIYAGLVGIEGALSRWMPAPLGRKVVVLGCGCGDPDCYVAALAAPRRAAVPVRERPDVAALAAGVLSDHSAWLREMTTAFGRDFLFPGATERARTVADGALRAFAQRGEPLTGDAVRAWARDRCFGDEAVTQIVGRLRSGA